MDRRVFSTLGGYREYIKGCTVHHRDTMIYVGDIMNTLVDILYIVVFNMN